jgi:hypothetical protein
MTIQVETVNKDQKRSRWHATKNWLTVIAEGMDYDPQEYANSMVRHLQQKVEQLESRVNEIEGKKTSEAE